MTDVSVVIPTYNRAELVSEAIESCLAQLRDADFELQVVVVDDASTDDTARVLTVMPPEVEVLRLDDNRGAAAARNRGLENVRGTFVKFLDSDDVLLPGALGDEIAMARHTAADMVVSGWEVVTLTDDGDTVPGSLKMHPAPVMEPIVDSVLAGRASATAAVLYRTSYVDGLRWDPGLVHPEDWDWFCRAALRRGRIERLDRATYRLRHHLSERVSATGMLAYAYAHHKVLQKLERWLRENGEWSDRRAKRLAQYYYKQLRVLCVHDPDAFHRMADHILELDPDFVPVEEEPQAPMRALARLVGFRRALLAHTTLKRLIGRA